MPLPDMGTVLSGYGRWGTPSGILFWACCPWVVEEIVVIIKRITSIAPVPPIDVPVALTAKV